VRRDDVSSLDLFFRLITHSVCIDIDESGVPICEYVPTVSAAMYGAVHVGSFSALRALKPGAKFLIINTCFDELFVALWAEKTAFDKKVVDAVNVSASRVLKESLALYVN